MTLLSHLKNFGEQKNKRKRETKCKTISEALYPASNHNKKTNAKVG